MVYPRVCPLCNELLWEDDRICGKCRDSIEYISEPYCLKCGKSIEYAEKEYCLDCMKSDHLFTAGRAVFQYRDDIKKSIYRFKYKNKREYASFYGEEMAKCCGAWIKAVAPQVFIPVPLYPKKQAQRGYNQAELIARALSDHIPIPVADDLVYRVKSTVPQKELSDDSRKKNMKKAFKMAENIVKLNVVMVIDDIYTTGSTMDAISEVLLSAGVKEIYCLSLSIGSGF
ncbi:MAG: ComF family protein [Lachnospiraceae bacterium]|nr:ComF family protein [Lachnospiraceae bacterium]